jgi:hypothetical protein
VSTNRGSRSFRVRHVGEGEIAFATASSMGDDPPRRVRRDVLGGIELGALVVVDDHNLGRGPREAHRDRRRCERGEERHVHCTEPPDSQQRDDQSFRLAHQDADAITLGDAHACETGGEPFGLRPQLAERQIVSREIGRRDRERDVVGGMVIAEHRARHMSGAVYRSSNSMTR